MQPKDKSFITYHLNLARKNKKVGSYRFTTTQYIMSIITATA